MSENKEAKEYPDYVGIMSTGLEGSSPFSESTIIQRGINGVRRQFAPLTMEQRRTRLLNAEIDVHELCSEFKPSQMADRRVDLTDEEQAVILKKTPHVLRVNENVVCFGDAYYIVAKDQAGEEHVACRIWTKSNESV